jgi:hypothetical protein
VARDVFARVQSAQNVRFVWAGARLACMDAMDATRGRRCLLQLSENKEEEEDVA